MFTQQGVDDYPLFGWRRIQAGELELFDKPKSQRYNIMAEVFVVVMSNKICSGEQEDARIAMSSLHQFITKRTHYYEHNRNTTCKRPRR